MPHRCQFDALLGIGLQQASKYLTSPLTDMRWHIVFPRANLLKHVFAGRAGLKRVLASEHEIQQHTEGPRVYSDSRVFLILNDLWSSVSGGSALKTEPVSRPHQFPDTEIYYFDDVAAAAATARWNHENIVQFYVPGLNVK
jgi:hypothetical protein